MEATKVEIEQLYWAGIHDSLINGIQFVENHAGLTESTEGSPQRPAKKRPRFSRVLDTQIRIPVFPPLRARPSSPPSLARQSRLPPPPPPPAIVDDSQFESAEFQMSPSSHPTPAVPVSHPPPQVIPHIQVLLTTST